MTVLTNSGFETTAAAPTFGALALIELRYRSGTMRVTNWPVSVDALGHTWSGLGSFAVMSPLHESEDGASEKLTLSLSGVDIGVRSLALGDPSDYQDQPVLLYVALVDATTFQLIGEPVLRFSGVMDQLKITREKDKATVSMDCRSAVYNINTNPTYLRSNDVQHKARHPGEKGFELLAGIIGTPTVWMSRKYQLSANNYAAWKAS